MPLAEIFVPLAALLRISWHMFFSARYRLYLLLLNELTVYQL
ncbi:hypothetical protein ACZ87_03228 [Candidatus Erwinia dacicola]|uniref:Uncharacterized protein n=1 Tax=Candidatus Erwinia dacicola TaxID=252393 RepID=A0A328TLW8_9GAMM|nr:hypothetical protein ACZ87_03228 [Candidatus Erwinia dacicola]